MNFLRQFFTIVIVTAFIFVGKINAQSMKTYFNDRYGYVVSYPDFMIAGEEPMAKDGVTIKMKGANAEKACIIVFGGFNDMNIFSKSLSDSYKEAINRYVSSGVELKSSKLRKDGFDISGIESGYHFYRRVIWKDGYYAEVTVKYLREMKPMCGPYVKKVLSSLHFPVVDE